MKIRILYALLIGLMFACQPDAPLETQDSTSSDELSIAEAKAWFEAHISSTTPNARTSGGMGAFTSRTPIWQLATQVKTKGSKTGWLVPLNFNQLRRYTFKNGLQSSNRAQNMLMTYLLQYKENGKMTLKVLEYMPEDSYLAKNKDLVYAQDFSGKVFVKSWEGKTIGGGEYQNGKRLTTFSPKSANGRTSATVCNQIATAYFTNGCVFGQEVIVFGHHETVDGCSSGFLINTQTFPTPYGTCAGWSLTDVDCINVCREVPDPIYDPNPIFFPPAGGAVIADLDNQLMTLQEPTITNAEKAILNNLPNPVQANINYRLNAVMAATQSRVRYNMGSFECQDNTCNAYKHALFNALNASFFGVDVARSLGEAREGKTLSNTNCAITTDAATYMDLVNNEKGYSTYIIYQSVSSLPTFWMILEAHIYWMANTGLLHSQPGC